MVRFCAAIGCTNKYSKENNLTFHRFPHKNQALLQRWVIATRRQFTPSKHSVLCSAHFVPESFRRVNGYTYVYENAIPTIFNFSGHLPKVTGMTDQGQNRSRKIPSVQSLNVERKAPKNPGSYCSALNCGKSRGKNPHLSFFAFPKEKERSRVWVQNCRRLDLMKKTTEQLQKSYCFCGDHFEDSQFMNSNKRDRLIWSAIPTVFNVPNPPKRLEVKRPLPERSAPQVTNLKTSQVTNLKTSQVTNLKTYSKKDGKYVTISAVKPNGASDARGTSTVTTSEVAGLINVNGCNAADIRIEAVHSNYQSHEDAAESIWQCIDPVCSKERRTLSERLTNTTKKMRAIRTQRYRLNKKVKKLEEEKENSSIPLEKIIVALKDYLKDEVLEVVTAQLLIASSKYTQIRWSDKVKNLFLNVYRSGPKAYKKMSEMFYLPNVKGLRLYERKMENLVCEQDVPKVGNQKKADLAPIEHSVVEMDTSSLVYDDIYFDAESNMDLEGDGECDLQSTVVLEECFDDFNNESGKNSEPKSVAVNVSKSSFQPSKPNNRDATSEFATGNNIELVSETSTLSNACTVIEEVVYSYATSDFVSTDENNGEELVLLIDST